MLETYHALQSIDGFAMALGLEFRRGILFSRQINKPESNVLANQGVLLEYTVDSSVSLHLSATPKFFQRLKEVLGFRRINNVSAFELKSFAVHATIC